MAAYRNNDLIQVLADYLQGRKSQVLLTPQLISCATVHHVSGILYQQTGDPALYNSYLQELFFYKNRQVLLAEIRQLFEEHHIDYFLVKGPEIAPYYPRPELRMMGDCDLVVRDRPRAAGLLREHEYTYEEDDRSELAFTKDYLRFEVHDRLLYTGDKRTLAFFNRCWDMMEDHHLDWNLHFIFLLAHLRKHITEHGAGFRMFMDIAVITQHAQELLDWNVVIKGLKEIRLLGFAKTVFELNHRWFDVQPPFAVPVLSDEFLSYAADLTTKNGAYGYNNLERMVEGTVEMRSSTDHHYCRTMFSRFLHRCFPGYLELIVWPEYSFLSGRKYLLPVCWIYRLLRNAFHLSNWKSLKAYSTVSKAQFDRKNEELKKWGL